MTMKPDIKNEVCKHCDQETTYALAIDRGTTEIVKQIARYIGIKGINMVHPRKEMEGSYLSSNQVGNLSRARFHGLIAHVRGESGNYLLTSKGSKFLKGEPIPKYAVIRKGTKKDSPHNDGYYLPGLFQVRIEDFNSSEEYWEGVNYEIQEGRVIRNLATLDL